ncbi:MAG: hypothetical protein V1701_07650 [Planctomycetota bacterium]
MKWIIGILSVISFLAGATVVYSYFDNPYFWLYQEKDYLICGIGAVVFPVIILITTLIPILANFMAIRKTKKIVITSSLILAIISALGVLPLLMSLSHNHLHPAADAIYGLKMIVSQEAIWRQTDADGNGIKDFWTYDVSCLHRMYRSDNQTKIGYIDRSFARADARPAFTGTFGQSPGIENWENPPMIITPTSGYLFRAMLIDENGIPYNQNEVGTNRIKAANPTKFAFVIYPGKYDTYFLVYTFIVNEEGKIYVKDTKAEPVLQWPAKDPTTVGWQLAE